MSQPQQPQNKDISIAVGLLGVIILTPLSVVVNSRPLAFIALICGVMFSYLFVNKDR